jgi:hypothetical protein
MKRAVWVVERKDLQNQETDAKNRLIDLLLQKDLEIAKLKERM